MSPELNSDHSYVLEGVLHSMSSFDSVFVPDRWAERAFQVDPISSRRFASSIAMNVVMPMTRPPASLAVKGNITSAA